MKEETCFLNNFLEIPFYKRPAEAISTSWSTIAIAKEAYDIRQIFKESVGYCYGYDYTDTETIEASAKECGEMSIGWLKSPSIDLDPTKRCETKPSKID